MTDLIQKLRQTNFEDLKGSILKVDFPISEDWLNKLLNETIEHEYIQSVSTDISYRNDHIILMVILNMSARLPPFFRMKQFTAAIELVLQSPISHPWEKCMLTHIRSISSVDLGRFNEKLVVGQIQKAIQESIPDHFFLEEDWVGVRLKSLLNENDLTDVLPYFKDGKIYLKPGDHQFFVSFTLEI